MRRGRPRHGLTVEEAVELVQRTLEWGWQDHLATFGSAAVWEPDERLYELMKKMWEQGSAKGKT